uniref:Uncharacterized protein n=1 Tax=Aegilops tauschii TaxID=37682 RepID=M8D5Y8_AEGTA
MSGSAAASGGDLGGGQIYGDHVFFQSQSACGGGDGGGVIPSTYSSITDYLHGLLDPAELAKHLDVPPCYPTMRDAIGAVATPVTPNSSTSGEAAGAESHGGKRGRPSPEEGDEDRSAGQRRRGGSQAPGRTSVLPDDERRDRRGSDSGHAQLVEVIEKLGYHGYHEIPRRFRTIYESEQISSKIVSNSKFQNFFAWEVDFSWGTGKCGYQAVSELSGRSEKKKTKEGKREKKPRGSRVAFATKSEVDHLDDGYRWRKYGQKAVKNSSFPRSYYRCTAAQCGVKKLVERSQQDPSTVVTTYEGRHAHPSPVAAHCGSRMLMGTGVHTVYSLDVLQHQHRGFFPAGTDVYGRMCAPPSTAASVVAHRSSEYGGMQAQAGLLPDAVMSYEHVHP